MMLRDGVVRGVAGAALALVLVGALDAGCTGGDPALELSPPLVEALGVDASVDAAVDSGAPPGTTCSSDGDCASGSCAGGHCCIISCLNYCTQSTQYWNSSCDTTGICHQTSTGLQVPTCDSCGPSDHPSVGTEAVYLGHYDVNCNLVCGLPDGTGCYLGGIGLGLPNGVCTGGVCVFVPQANGYVGCSDPTQCESGFCTPFTPGPRTCCNAPCDGPCDDCSSPTPGVCGPAPDGRYCPGGTCLAGVCTPPSDAGSDSGTGGSGTSTSSGTSGSGTTTSGATSSGTGTSTSGATSSSTGSSTTTTSTTTSSGTGGAGTSTSGATSSGTVTATGTGGRAGTGGADAGPATGAGAGSPAANSSCAVAYGPGSIAPWGGLALALLLRRRRARA